MSTSDVTALGGICGFDKLREVSMYLLSCSVELSYMLIYLLTRRLGVGGSLGRVYHFCSYKE